MLPAINYLVFFSQVLVSIANLKGVRLPSTEPELWPKIKHSKILDCGEHFVIEESNRSMKMVLDN